MLVKFIIVMQSMCVCYVLSRFSCVWLFATPWTVACHAPLSMRFSMQKYWSGLPCPPPGDPPNPGIKPATLMSPKLAGGFLTSNGTWETIRILENIEEGHLPVWGGAGGCQRGEAYSVLRDDPELHRFVRMKGHCRDQDRYEQRKSKVVRTGKNSKQLAFF